MSEPQTPRWESLEAALQDGRLDRRTLMRGLLMAGGAAVLGPSLVACSGVRGATGGSPGTPSQGGKVTVGIATSLADFDPYNHLAVNFPMMATLYSYLITYSDDYQPHPDLAEEWKTADDKLSATITLRSTVFHDGTAVTAKDVVTGITRALDPKLGLSETATASIIKTATAVDERTVRLDFNAPAAESRVLDFMYWFPVVQGSRNTAEQLKQAPAGSGPFVLDSYSPGNNLILKKNPRYYDSPKPYLDELEIRFFDSQDSLVSALRAGSVDSALALDARYINQLQKGYTVVKGAPGALISLFRMNPLKPPFDNKKVRQAVARSIDRDRIIKEVQSGVGQPVYTSFPPNSPGFEAELLNKYSFDLQAARALLDASGGGKSATVSVAATSKADVSALLIIQEDLKTIGFDLQLNTMDTTSVNAQYLDGSLQCVIRASSNAYSSPMGVTQDSAFRLAKNALWKDQIPKDYRDAVTGLNRAATTAEVDAASKQLNAVIMDEAWAIGLYTVNALSALSTRVVGFTRTPADHPVFTDVKRT